MAPGEALEDHMRSPRPAVVSALLCALVCSSSAVAASAPDTTITSGPSQTYRRAIATFAFTSNKGGVSFECSLDGAAWTSCRSPYARQVANGAHRFSVRARSGSTVDATPATRD